MFKEVTLALFVFIFLTLQLIDVHPIKIFQMEGWDREEHTYHRNFFPFSSMSTMFIR